MIDINLDGSIIDKLSSIGCTSFNLTPDEIKRLELIDEDKIFEDIYQKVIEATGCPLSLKEESTNDI